MTQRIADEIRVARPIVRRAAGADPEIFVYCRAATEVSVCTGSVARRATHEVVAGQRWSVRTRQSGNVLSARALDKRLVPAGPLAQRLAELRLARRAHRHKRTSLPLARLSLKGSSDPLGGPTYVCVSNGHGRVLFQGLLRAPRVVRFRAPQLRLNLGNANPVVHVNGTIYRIPASPYGLSIVRHHIRYLPEGKRPCA